MHDLKTVPENIATRETMTKPTAPQDQWRNPIGKALVERITRVGPKDGQRLDAPAGQTDLAQAQRAISSGYTTA
ncbi:hypothetical protein [Pseudorhodoferax sp.]|uniref:hypothetical protein n=1 Tax=Pseudorhodoferax sp. TaxID=1993553 RepID=UPI0039E2F49B